MNETEAPGYVDAKPTKRFFVRMLVRDIELVPAIVDLVDNSVDGARLAAKRSDLAEESETPLSGYRVDIALAEDRFVIADNCGGIALKDAVDYAFRFGRPEEVEPIVGEVGQFGVGMKRALFKLGEWFCVDSTSEDSRFRLEVDVVAWLEDKDNWTFPIVSSNPVTRAKGDDNPGTRIEVKQLLSSVAAEFTQDMFLQRLRSQIEFRHNIAIDDGLEVTLNDNVLRSRAPSLLTGPEVVPRVVTEELTANGETVRMELYAGFVDLSDEDANTDDPDEFSGGSLAGWYLICNGRMLLFADKSRLTGWGQEVADYHPQYRRFRGYVYLSGNSSAMPWNTAKTGVDEDSPVWRSVRAYIVDALRDARSVMNRIKTEVQENDDTARPVTAMLRKAEPTRLADLAPSPAIIVPPRPPRQPPSTKKITYAVPVEEFDDVAASLEVSTAVDVGRGTFEYYYRREVGD
jgi:hypothetical protein